jgi:branched-chain amino acid transport system substrate-binding protein
MTRDFFRAAACALGAVASLAIAFSAQAQEPIRIGFLTVRTGPLAAGGRQMEQGIELFLKERNNTIAGRKVELIIGDTGGNPAGAKTKTQELVERNKVHVIIGPLAAFEAIAIDDYIRQAQIPTVSCSAAAEDLTQRKANPWFVRTSASSGQPNHAVGDYAAKVLGYKRVVIIADDFAYGHETAAGFQRVFEDSGGKVVQKLWPPLNVADYGSYVGQIKADTDGLYAGFAGINGLRFLKQYGEYQAGKRSIFGNPTCVDEGVLRNMGDEALGVYSASWYSAAIETPENKRFVEAIQKDYNVTPGFYTVGTYVSGMVLEAALAAVKGRFEDKPAFIKALHEARVDKSPMGPIRVDEYGKAILTIYVRKVERRNGKLVNAIVATYPNVTQFYTYDPKQFLANPVYSRDYPPAKNLEP